MSQQPALKYSWNTMVASSFWDMRLSIACAATDAEFQNRIILQDNALNCALTPSSPARAPLPSEVPDPIVTIETSKMILALEDGSK